MLRVSENLGRQPMEETRQRILVATREIFAQKGSRGTTTREVAERAGVNEATLFRHFGTKQQLLQDMLDNFCASTEDQLSFVDRLSGPIEEQLRELCRVGIGHIADKRDLICVSIAEEALNPESGYLAWRGPNVAQRKLSEYMQSRIDMGELHGDAMDLARVLMSFMFAYVVSAKIWPREADQREHAIDLFVNIFLNGARGT